MGTGMSQQNLEKFSIVDYQPSYAEAFRTLNQEWIEAYFRMEDTDEKVLKDPEGEILAKGGCIQVALLEGEAVGVCALVPHGEDCLELAKMAVAPRARGYGVGKALGVAVIEKARSLGARRLYLGSNTLLEAAIRLYRSLGFQELEGEVSPYERCNIQMELRL